MRTRVNPHDTQFPAPQVSEDRIESASFVFDDEEDPFCDTYLVASREGDIPALQEYLQELRTE
jgi:hypothetical protein